MSCIGPAISATVLDDTCAEAEGSLELGFQCLDCPLQLFDSRHLSAPLDLQSLNLGCQTAEHCLRVSSPRRSIL
jgi:hypothetical protein